MKKRISMWMGLISLIIAVPVFAEDPAPATDPAPAASGWGADLAVDVVSNYVWRGYDVNQSYFDQKGKKYTGMNVAPALQPSVTINTPLEGLSLNIWGSMTMVGRNDKDADHRLQYNPGGDNLLTASSNPLIAGSLITPIISATGISPTAATDLVALYTAVATAYTNGPGTTGTPGVVSVYNFLGNSAGAPGFYKETNGTKRVDEMDYTLNYTTSGKLGTVNMGVVAYYLPNVVSVGSHAQTELYLSYSLPFLSDLSLAMYDDLRSSDQYYKLAYGHEFEFTENASLALGASAGYGVISVPSQRQGMMDVAGNATFTFHGLRIGANVVYRPDPKMYDTDTTPNYVPAWIDGASTSTDGMVADPSKNYGLMNELVNGIASQYVSSSTGLTGYSYTPRQKLPRTLYWFSIGYSTSI